MTALDAVPQEKWDALSGQRIFFGHQSVGYNIITGIEGILQERHNIKLDILNTSKVKEVNQPGLAHEWIGRNTDPVSKLEAFAALLHDKFGKETDIAMMKFCYVDITSDTDIDTLFIRYKTTLAELRKEFPETIFVHVTVPLTTKPQGIDGVKAAGKNMIKKIMGKPVFDYKDNIKRNLFNNKMKAEYEGREPLFDLAGLEAGYMPDRPSSFARDNTTYLTLAAEYTNDGGHLNEAGARKIGEQFLFFLAQHSR
ncbi:MAG: hypothetical protein SCH71_15440 [Desulfobulbaceae bacterium]|nr:hypothetical protein [Desulfobulbaceae bacterium]